MRTLDHAVVAVMEYNQELNGIHRGGFKGFGGQKVLITDNCNHVHVCEFHMPCACANRAIRMGCTSLGFYKARSPSCIWSYASGAKVVDGLGLINREGLGEGVRPGILLLFKRLDRPRNLGLERHL